MTDAVIVAELKATCTTKNMLKLDIFSLTDTKTGTHGRVLIGITEM